MGIPYEPCPHKNCRYHWEGESFHLGNCRYLEMTGQSRILGLTLEQAMDKEHCPKYEPKNGETPVRSVRRSSPIPVDHTNARIRELYDQGLCDRDIAEKLGIRRQRVCNWRKRNKQKANREPPHTKYDWELGLQLYRSGMSDGKIAEELGCSLAAVSAWRMRRELPANFPPPRVRLDYELARQLYDEGLNDAQIAERLKCHERTVLEWRKKNGLIAQKYRRVKDGN